MNNKPTQTKDLSIVIPVYNEQENLSQLYLELSSVLEKLDLNSEIIFIDDGSTDRSFNILKEIQDKDSKVKVIQFRRNFGKSAALSCGFKNVQGKVIVTLDADLQDEPQEIPNLLQKLNQGYDLVSGWKHKRQDPLSKTIPSALFNKVVSFITGIKIHDFNCGLKVYQKEVIDQIKVYGELHRFLPVIAYQKGFRIGEAKVKHNPRRKGRSKYGAKRFFKGFFDLLTVILLTKYSRRPLHFFGIPGLLISGIGFIICLYLTILWFMGQRPIGNRPLLLLGILLLILGIQIITIGLVGEMITYRSYRESDNYLIKRNLG